MKQKNNTYVLVTVFFVIVLCVLAYFYLKKNNNSEMKIWIQAQSKEIKKVKGLDEIIKDVKFINNQEEDIITEDFSEDINVSVKIENNAIAIRTKGKSVNVTSIKNPVSVSTFYVGGEDSLFVDVYVLNKDKQLYHIGFASADFAFDGVKVTLLALPDIESYSTNVRMLDDRENASNFVLAKGVDGKYYTDYEFENDTEYTLREIANYVEGEVEEENEKELSYGIYSTKEVNPFKDLDFNSRVNAPEGKEIDFDSKSIKYNGYYYEDSEERKQNITINVKNVKQVALYCDETAGPCSSIYYLTSEGNLYEVVALEDGFFQKDADGTYKKSTKLIEKNVTSFSLIPVIIYDVSTGGEQSIVIKKNDGKMYLVSDKTYSLNSFKRLWVDGTYSDPLYVINKSVKVNKNLQTSDGKNLIAKKIYTFEGNEEDGDGDSFIYIYVLNEDDYIYEIDDYTKDKANKFKDKKVKKITERDDDILVTFVDDTTEIIDAYLEYEAK